MATNVLLEQLKINKSVIFIKYYNMKEKYKIVKFLMFETGTYSLTL